jgi:hypothetical protein
MGGHVEVEDVADVGDVEAAGGDVARDQERVLPSRKLVERRHACATLVHVAMQRAGREAVLLQRAVQQWRRRACGCRR